MPSFKTRMTKRRRAPSVSQLEKWLEGAQFTPALAMRVKHTQWILLMVNQSRMERSKLS